MVAEVTGEVTLYLIIPCTYVAYPEDYRTHVSGQEER